MLYPDLIQMAKKMRGEPTAAEARMWSELESKKLGVKFRRQHIIDRFIVDFYCVKQALVIEVDGDIHDLQKDRDYERGVVLRNLGHRILRFRNERVLGDTKSVINEIKQGLSIK